MKNKERKNGKSRSQAIKNGPFQKIKWNIFII